MVTMTTSDEEIEDRETYISVPCSPTYKLHNLDLASYNFGLLFGHLYNGYNGFSLSE